MIVRRTSAFCVFLEKLLTFYCLILPRLRNFATKKVGSDTEAITVYLINTVM